MATIDERADLIGLSVGNLASVDGDPVEPEQLLLPFGRKDRSMLDDAVDSLGDASATLPSRVRR